MVLDKKPFCYKELGAMGIVTFLDEKTGEYGACPLEHKMPLHKAKRRAEMLNKSYSLKMKELADE